MRTKLIYALAAGLMLLSCAKSGEESSKEDVTETNIIGTWVIKMINGEELYSNEYFACRFNRDGGQDYFILEDSGIGMAIKYTDDVTYNIKNSTINMTSNSVELVFPASISEGELCGERGDILTYSESINIEDGVDENDNRTFTAIRSTVDYEESIIGMWEGTAIEGDTSEPFANIRLDFKGNGLYAFYKKESSDSDWVSLVQNNKYALMGSIVAMQWTEDTEETSAEIWDNVIEGDTMKWRATREGLDFVAGFDFVRVEE